MFSQDKDVKFNFTSCAGQQKALHNFMFDKITQLQKCPFKYKKYIL